MITINAGAETAEMFLCRTSMGVAIAWTQTRIRVLETLCALCDLCVEYDSALNVIYGAAFRSVRLAWPTTLPSTLTLARTM